MDTASLLQHFGESVPTYIAMIGTQIAVIWVTIKYMKQNQEERDQTFRERMALMESEQASIRKDMSTIARQYQDVARDTAVIREKVEWIVKSLDDLKRK